MKKKTLDEQDSTSPKSTLTSPQTILEIPTKTDVDNLHENSRIRGDLSSVFNDQDIELKNINLNFLDAIASNRDPSPDKNLANKNYTDNSIGEGTIVRFNQTLQNYHNDSVGNDV